MCFCQLKKTNMGHSVKTIMPRQQIFDMMPSPRSTLTHAPDAPVTQIFCFLSCYMAILLLWKEGTVYIEYQRAFNMFFVLTSKIIFFVSLLLSSSYKHYIVPTFFTFDFPNAMWINKSFLLFLKNLGNIIVKILPK